MAKSKDGFFGKLSGKIGNVVVGSWKGIPYIRSRPKPYTSNTPAQKRQRSKFGLVIKFVNRIRPVINAGFKRNTSQMTELNSATSYLIKRAVVTDDDEQAGLHYPSVLVTRGDVAIPLDPEAEPVGDGIRFGWNYDQSQPGARGDDKVIVLAYDPEHSHAWYAISEEARRKDESITLPISPVGEGLLCETYLAFVLADGTDASDSVYLGQLSLAGE